MTVRPCQLLAALLPPTVVAMEHVGVADPGCLYPVETAHLGRAVPKRLEEYAAGRLCARACLEQLGIHRFPLRAAEDRRPLWPEGIVGGITHTRGFRAAVAARREAVTALGVDAEWIAPLEPEVLARIATPEETAWLDRLPPEDRARHAMLVFSAKEAFYKCQHELTRAFVDFPEVTLAPDQSDLGAGEFVIVTCRAIGPIPRGTAFSGRYVFDGERVVTALHLPA
jgi:4'-phosphopantetheinyl transferase EntD